MIERPRDITLSNGGGLNPYAGAARQLKCILPAGVPPQPRPTAYETPYSNGTGVEYIGWRTHTAGCTRLHRPMAVSLAGDRYDNYGGGYSGHLRRATEAA
jgi:hypothetical protein